MSFLPKFLQKTQISRISPKTLIQLGILFAAGSLSSATGSMVAPVFPEVISDLRIDPLWAGLLVSIHTLTIALATPVLGLLANRLGHRPILLGSLISYALFGSLGALAHNFGSMFLCRALTGAASGGIASISIGILSSKYESETRAKMMGYATSALASATVLFPLLGGWVGTSAWQHAFLLHGLALPVALLVFLFLKIPAQIRSVQSDLNGRDEILRILKKRPVITHLLALALASALFYVVVVYAPLYLKTAMNASPLINGAVLAARAIGATVISAFGASRLAGRLGSVNAIAIGFFLMSISLMCIPLVATPMLIVLSALPFGLGFGIVMPNLYNGLADYAPPVHRTALLAIGTGISSLGQFLSPAAFGPIWVFAGASVFFAAAASGICVFGFMVSSNKFNR